MMWLHYEAIEIRQKHVTNFNKEVLSLNKEWYPALQQSNWIARPVTAANNTGEPCG